MRFFANLSRINTHSSRSVSRRFAEKLRSPPVRFYQEMGNFICSMPNHDNPISSDQSDCGVNYPSMSVVIPINEYSMGCKMTSEYQGECTFTLAGFFFNT